MSPELAIYLVAFLGGFILGMLFRNSPPRVKVDFTPLIDFFVEDRAIWQDEQSEIREDTKKK